ncbi:MAG: tonB-system energizer ExbB [Luteimonas sp.]
MYLSADWVVQAVMAGLVVASIATWTILVAKSWELGRTRRVLHAARAVVVQAPGLGAISSVPILQDGLPGALLDAVHVELRLSEAAPSPGGIRERVGSRLERLEAAHLRRLRKGTGMLATIGATAPFVGLFGTVWGIMNAFIGIAHSSTTNLAVVAPGIAEALLATGLGLVAAIPAVIVYNHFTRTLAGLRGLSGDLSAGIQQLLSRDLDRTARSG